MRYKVSGIVKGENIAIEYDKNTSSSQARQAFRLLYPTARRVKVEGVVGKKEEVARARDSNRLERDLERGERAKLANNPYYH